MDNQHPSSGLPLLPDPFSPEHDQSEQPSPPFVLPVASTAASAEKPNPARQTQTFGAFSGINNPQHPFISLSPSPSPNTQNAFNPDDFFASPPQQQHTTSLIQHTERFTPELKRRLFGPSDPLSSTPSTVRRSPSKPYSLGFSTPIPRPSFTNPLSSNATEDGNNSFNISPTFSPSSKLFADVVPPSQSIGRTESNPVQPALSKVTIVSQTLPPQPGTPFTPLVQKAKCSCKASKCLKLYCPCFASSGFCGPDCTCKNCKNSVNTAKAVREARETVLARDPRAFDPKVRNSPATASGGDIHSKGCNCRKGCAKNYCVCRELRVDCGPRCTCSGPNGCLNGKSDAMEDHQFKGKAEYILGGSKSRPSPGRPRNSFLSKSARTKSFGSGFKRERKRLKKDPRDKAIVSPSVEGIADVLSPSFPSFSFSPRDNLTNNIEEFRKVLAGGDDFMTPISQRKDRWKKVRMETEEPDEVVVSSFGERSGGEGTVLTSITLPEAAPQDGPIQSKGAQSSICAGAKFEDNDAKESGKQDVEMKESLPQRGGDTNEDLSNVQLNNVPTRTPERRKILGDLEAASSPTTDDKETAPRVWSNLRGTLFGREEKIEICRLPRILRVKMGSGRLLRKFDL